MTNRHGLPEDNEMIKTGQQVWIKPEYQDEGDDQIKWIAVDDEEKGRVTIQAQLGLSVNPTQVVDVEWLDERK